jgi:hypothetical protein
MFVAQTLVPHVSVHEGRGLEQLLAEYRDRPLGGAVIEATYAATDPPLLTRLRGLRVPYTIDPQSIRFASPRYLNIAALSGLPYSPAVPFPRHAASQAVDAMVLGSLHYQAQHEVDLYLTPTLPMHRPTLSAVQAHHRIHTVAADAIGTDVPARPLLAAVAPTLQVMRSPYAVYEQLLDRAYDGIYVQPIRLNPKHDSVEWLVSYAEFLLAAHEYTLPVVAARAGAFGLALTALGVDVFDAGLGERESFNLAALNRPPADRDEQHSGGPRRRTYAHDLLTSLDTPRLRAVIASPTLAPRFSCDLGSCRFGGYDEQLQHPRPHFFHVRQAELEALRRLPTTEMRVQHMRERLQSAIEVGRLVNRCLEDARVETVRFDHLDRWMAALTRVATRLATETAR